jgi:hypothetical protein
MNYNEQLIQRLVEPYRDQVGDGEFLNGELAAWAISNKLWEPPMKSKIAMLCSELSEAMRSMKRTVKGRKVRQYHCIVQKLSNGLRQTVWAHIDVATPEFMEDSVQRRRTSLAGKAFQLHSDIVYWNEYKNPGRPLEVLFDFRDDNADRDHALENGTYKDDEDDDEGEGLAGVA